MMLLVLCICLWFIAMLPLITPSDYFFWFCSLWCLSPLLVLYMLIFTFKCLFLMLVDCCFISVNVGICFSMVTLTLLVNDFFLLFIIDLLIQCDNALDFLFYKWLYLFQLIVTAKKIIADIFSWCLVPLLLISIVRWYWFLVTLLLTHGATASWY